MKRILLHSCCGPCSTQTITELEKEYDITVYFYNPNIEPKEEYEKRKKEQNKFINSYKGNKVSFIEGDYDNDIFKNNIRGLELEPEGGARCISCFKQRLDKTGKLAKQLSYDLFSTTLTVSPYKNSDNINNIGQSIQNKYDIPFLKLDLKKNDGYKKSIMLSKEYDLYRQDYCGCLHSKREN